MDSNIIIRPRRKDLAEIRENFITAPRRKDLAEERQKVNMEICRQYQKWLIDEISSINMGNKDANLTVLEKIKSCMKDVKLRVRVFEMSSHGTGYRRHCDVSERKRFVDMILQIVHNSDYIRKLYEIWRIAYRDNNVPSNLYDLKIKYSKLKQWIGLLKNTEESNFYRYLIRI